MSEIESKLFEALNRYNQINNYGKKMIMEQEIPPADAPADVPPAEAGATAPPADAPADMPAEDPALDMPAEDPTATDPTMDVGGEQTMDETEEIDITDLVNMTKSIKKDLDEKGDASDAVLGKMDDVFKKIDDLESRIGEMDAIIDKIDQLGYKVEKMKEPTPEEKLQMRSLDSYPFNKTTDEFFNEKMPEMQKTGKNEYVITPDDVEDYSKEDLRQSFNTEEDDEEENPNKM